MSLCLMVLFITEIDLCFNICSVLVCRVIKKVKSITNLYLKLNLANFNHFLALTLTRNPEHSASLGHGFGFL